MMRIAMSPAAAALLRVLVARAGADRNRILLTEAESTDWHSLTFAGERHQIAVRVTGSDSLEIARRICAGLEDVEFDIRGLVVGDIAVVRAPSRGLDGASELTIEALTIACD
jgi:glycine cleavage system regulatory protein